MQHPPHAGPTWLEVILNMPIFAKYCIEKDVETIDALSLSLSLSTIEKLHCAANHTSYVEDLTTHLYVGSFALEISPNL